MTAEKPAPVQVEGETGGGGKPKPAHEMTRDEFEKQSWNGPTGRVDMTRLPKKASIRGSGVGEKAVQDYMEVLQGKGNPDLAAQTDRPMESWLHHAVSEGGEIPIKVDFMGGRLNVVDGQHRLEAYRRLGAKQVPVTFTNTGGGVPDYAEGWPTHHETLVRSAIAAGKPVPDHVRAEYPDITEQSSDSKHAPVQVDPQPVAEPDVAEPTTETTEPKTARTGDEMSADDVGRMLADQHGNKKAGRTADDLRDRWVSSKKFVRMEVPTDAVTPATEVEAGAQSHSTGPIVVDKNKTGMGRHLGAYGAAADVLILDGKHRHAAAKAAGKKTIEAMVGEDAVPHVQAAIDRHREKTERAAVAVKNFFDNPDGSSLRQLRAALPANEVDRIRAARRDHAVGKPIPPEVAAEYPELAARQSSVDPTEPKTAADAPEFSSEPPPVADTPAPQPSSPADKRSSVGGVSDFGEHIPVRKHTARATGPKVPKDGGEEKSEAKPAWARHYDVRQDANTGKFFITHGKKTDGWGGPKIVYAGGRRGEFDTKEEAEAAIPLHAVARTHGVRQVRKPTARAAESTYGPDAAAIEAGADQIKKLQDEHQELLSKHEFHKRVERGVADGSIPAETMRKFREEGRMLNLEDQIKAAKVKEQIDAIRNSPVPMTGTKPPDVEGEEYEIYRKVTDRKTPTVKGGFKTYDEAMRHMATDPHSILDHKFHDWETYSYLDHVTRNGPEYKAGDVTPADFQKAFGFRGGVFGNWQTNKDGQTSLNHAYHALHDLSHVTGLTPEQLSLGGKLGIGFGADGTGGKHAAKAHYDPNKVLMNLTKMKGAGSLGHEWFHALDHALAKGEYGGDTDRLLTSNPAYQPKHKEVADAFKNLVGVMTHKQVTEGIDAGQSKRRADAFQQNIDRHLDDIARRLKYHEDYHRRAVDKGEKSRVKPLTAEQRQKWDELVGKIKAGDLGELKYEGGGRLGVPVHDTVSKLNELYKGATGRSLTAGGADSPANHLHWAIKRKQDADKRLADANEGATETTKQRTDFYNEALKLDQTRVGDYYTAPHEMAARAFSAYLEDKLRDQGRRSDYLSAKSDNKHYIPFGMRPFPEGEERTAINAAMDRLFDAVRKHYGKGGG